MYPQLWDSATEVRVRLAAKNLDAQPRAAGPYAVMCTRCVMTKRRPRIVFDAEGVCSACRYAERKQSDIDWAVRGQELENLLDRYCRRKPYDWNVGPYDVIVPASGGKDSAFVALELRRRGMNPLLARWAPHMVTLIGEQNWQSLLHAGFDGVTAQPNGLTHRRLSRLALEFYGDPFLPFIYGQLSWPFHVAVQNNVRLVFYGENGESEYGGDPSAENKPCWAEADWDRIYLKHGSFNQLLRLAVDLGVATEAACKFYRMPVSGWRPEFHWLGYYLPWHPQGNYYAAAEQAGFEVCEERSHATYSRYASIDDKLDFLHYRLGFVKFGIGRATSDAAHEIRDGELTRDEARALVQGYDDESPATCKYWPEALDYLGLTEDRYFAIEERFACSVSAS